MVCSPLRRHEICTTLTNALGCHDRLLKVTPSHIHTASIAHPRLNFDILLHSYAIIIIILSWSCGRPPCCCCPFPFIVYREYLCDPFLLLDPHPNFWYCCCTYFFVIPHPIKHRGPGPSGDIVVFDMAKDPVTVLTDITVSLGGANYFPQTVEADGGPLVLIVGLASCSGCYCWHRPATLLGSET